MNKQVGGMNSEQSPGKTIVAEDPFVVKESGLALTHPTFVGDLGSGSGCVGGICMGWTHLLQCLERIDGVTAFVHSGESDMCIERLRTSRPPAW